MNRVLYYSIIHAQKMGTLLMCLLILLIAWVSKEPIIPESISKLGPVIGWLLYLGIFCLLKIILGGWSSTSLKGMTWSVILSSAAGIGLSIALMKVIDGEISFWGILIQLALSITTGVLAYKWVDDLTTSAMADNLTLDNVVDSVFDSGLKNTMAGILGDIEDCGMYSISRGVAVYSNVILFSGLIIGMIF